MNRWKCSSCGYLGAEFYYEVDRMVYELTSHHPRQEMWDVGMTISCPRCHANALLPVTEFGEVEVGRRGVAK